eukprot:TRINITY_DN12_c1_g3_i1.p1 TRINITY_DN12_c1_g3~~TRINITY_DN12_c1_g3_i1.p1  ORF type:complete len:586 (+),score=145.24 TRINITY_DN12_c1_g3_i1:51-1760(+)
MQMQVGAPVMGQQQMFVVPNGGQFMVPQLGAPYGQMQVGVPQQNFEFQNVMSDEDGEASPSGMAAGGQAPFRHAPPADMNRPCKHNDWDDVRTRKGAKILRCRTCQAKWKLPSAKVPRCTPFLAGHCERGEACVMVHVRKKKSNLMERFEKFGDSVLRGVPPETWEKAKEDEDPGSVAQNMMQDQGASGVPGVPGTQVNPVPQLPHQPQQQLPQGQPPPAPAQPQQLQQQSQQPMLQQQQLHHPQMPVSPTNGQQELLMRRCSSTSLGVPSLLSTETLELPSPTGAKGAGHRYANILPPHVLIPAGPPSPRSLTTSNPPSLVCSPTNASGISPHAAGRRQLPVSAGVPTPTSATRFVKRGFAPPAIDTSCSDHRDPATWSPHYQNPGVSSSSIPCAMNGSLNDSQVLLPSDLLISPVDGQAAAARAAGLPQSANSPGMQGVPKVESVWTQVVTPQSQSATPAGGQSMQNRMKQQLVIATAMNTSSPPVTPSAAAAATVRAAAAAVVNTVQQQQQQQQEPPKPKQENDGVHAMSEAELDAHLEQLGLSPQNSPKNLGSNRPTSLPAQAPQ